VVAVVGDGGPGEGLWTLVDMWISTFEATSGLGT